MPQADLASSVARERPRRDHRAAAPTYERHRGEIPEAYDRLDKEVKRSFKKYTATNPPVIAKWNENHAHVLAGGKSAVLQEFKTAEGYTDFKLLSSASFHEWNAEHKLKIGDELRVLISKHWL